MTGSNTPTVVGLGEVLWDVFDDSRRPGGAPANVAFQAGQLGGRGVVCSRVGRDDLGDELVAFLAEHGLATDWIQRDEAHPTGTVTVDTSEARAPRYTIHEDVAWDHLAWDADLERLIDSASAVCFGTLAQRQSVSRGTIQAALDRARPRCLLVYDVNLRQDWYRREWIEASLAAANLVKLNDQEVKVLAELLETGSADHGAFARAVRTRFGVEQVCVTRGEKGCYLQGPGDEANCPGVEVEVADAVGAGDAFTAAWIMARLDGWPLARQAAFANRVGALVASRPGAMPPLRSEFAALRDEFN